MEAIKQDLEDAIKAEVFNTIGGVPKDFHKIDVRELWNGQFRVNIWCVREKEQKGGFGMQESLVESYTPKHCFWVTMDADGFLTVTPETHNPKQAA